jgi:AAA domain
MTGPSDDDWYAEQDITKDYDFEKYSAGFKSDPRRESNESPNGKTDESPVGAFKFIRFPEIRAIRDPDYLIKGVIVAKGLICVWGPPACGKTFFVLDVVMHIALGWEYRGRKIKQGPVLYISLEASEGFKKRVDAFRQHVMKSDADAPFAMLDVPVKLAKDHQALVAAIRQQLGDMLPVAIVIDTVNRSVTGSESSDEDMGAFIQAADMVRTELSCAVVVIHHCGWDASHMRGHTSLPGAIDVELAVTKDDDGNVTAEIRKMRDDLEGETITSKLKVVDLGENSEGDPITSCILIPLDTLGAAKKKAVKPKKLTAPAKIALAALNEAIREHGKVLREPDHHIPGGVKTVTLIQWRDFSFRRGISNSGNPDSSRRAFDRAANQLAAAGYIEMWDQYVWAL